MSLEPGLYKATVRGEPDMTVMIDDDGFGTTQSRRAGHHVHEAFHITDARLLIILDVPLGRPSSHWPRLADYLRRGGWDFSADQIEAQTKPPRIPEPGLWGVVDTQATTSQGQNWVRRPAGWHCPAHGFVRWDDLIDPVLIRDGVS